MSRVELRKVWEGRVSDFRESGQTASNWCSDNRINLHTLRYWLKKLGGHHKVGSTSPVNWLSVQMAGGTAHQPISGRGIVIRIGEARVEVERGCDLTLLGEVVQTLAALC